MVSKVVLVLHYNSPFNENINAKYVLAPPPAPFVFIYPLLPLCFLLQVFPHDDKAVVSGLEVFVGGKRIVAKVKEKETAHKEYRQAVDQGHGAYLMDQGIKREKKGMKERKRWKEN
jgi:hypothetical protein